MPGHEDLRASATTYAVRQLSNYCSYPKYTELAASVMIMLSAQGTSNMPKALQGHALHVCRRLAFKLGLTSALLQSADKTRRQRLVVIIGNLMMVGPCAHSLSASGALDHHMRQMEPSTGLPWGKRRNGTNTQPGSSGPAAIADCCPALFKSPLTIYLFD